MGLAFVLDLISQNGRGEEQTNKQTRLFGGELNEAKYLGENGKKINKEKLVVEMGN